MPYLAGTSSLEYIIYIIVQLHADYSKHGVPMVTIGRSDSILSCWNVVLPQVCPLRATFCKTGHALRGDPNLNDYIHSITSCPKSINHS